MSRLVPAVPLRPRTRDGQLCPHRFSPPVLVSSDAEAAASQLWSKVISVCAKSGLSTQLLRASQNRVVMIVSVFFSETQSLTRTRLSGRSSCFSWRVEGPEEGGRLEKDKNPLQL